jgi:hypothetical protein
MFFRIHIVLFVIISFCFNVNAQVGIGTVDPDPSAVLDISSKNSGILFPRLTEVEKEDISNPAHGLLIYQTDGIKGFYFWDNTKWKLIGSQIIETCNLQIGDEYQGGIIFYLDATGCHGLIAAKEDIEIKRIWSEDETTIIRAKGDRIGAGKMNTQLILNEYLSEDKYYLSAAYQCFIYYTVSGYGDWYLPSYYELDLMYENIGEGNVYGLNFNLSDTYWSSTERDKNTAYLCKLELNTSGTRKWYRNKNWYYPVRPIRFF